MATEHDGAFAFGTETGDVMTIAKAAQLLRNRHVSSVELTQQCLRQIDHVDPMILACVTVMSDSALEQARVADVTLAKGRVRSALCGIPMGIKDLIATKGVLTTGGSRVLEHWIPDEDATVVTKLAQAGAVAICKTNTHEFAFGTVTPPTRNPWDIECIPGGSSGGSAAAVVTGECLGALGTDTGGSIRIPAAACGITGLKPTFGLVSRTGILPLSWSLDHAGPLARTVEDCALLLDALAGYDSRDPGSVDVPLLDYTASLALSRSPEEAVRGMRLGIPTSFFFRHCDPEIESAVRNAISHYEELGVNIREISMPSEIDEMFEVYRAIQKPEAFTFHKEMGWLDTRSDKYRPAILEALLSGANFTASDYIRAQRARRTFSDKMSDILGEVDALLTPTLPVPPRRIDEIDTPLLYDGGPEPAGDSLRYTFPFDLTGHPALTVPCGFTISGLPIGLQLVARHFGEPTLLRMGHAYQRVTNWHLRIPPLALAPNM